MQHGLGVLRRRAGWNVPDRSEGEGFELIDPDTTPDVPAHRRRAQEVVDELARMGIDPRTLGLDRVGGSEPMLPAARDEPVPSAVPAPWTDPPAPARASDGALSPFLRPVRGRVAPPAPEDPDVDPVTTRPAVPVVAPTRTRQAVTAFGTGLVTAGSARRIQQEQDLVARIRAPQREHQVVVFVAGKGGVGVTATAAGIALTVATLRDDSVALVDVQSGTASLQHWLADGAGSTPPGLAEPTSPALRLSNGLDVVDGAPWQAPADAADLSALLGDLTRDHTFTFVDLGDDVGATAHRTLSAGTRVVVVTAADRSAARATRLTLGRIHHVQPARLRDVVIAVVCLERGQYRRVLRELRGDLGAPETQIVAIPYEPALATMDHLDLSRLRPGSREAYLRVAAALAGPRPPAPVVAAEVAEAPWAT